jgi:hypothetical protein
MRWQRKRPRRRGLQRRERQRGGPQRKVGIAKMTIFQKLFLAAFGGILLLLAVRRLRAYKLKERYALLWVLIGLPFLGLAFKPTAVAWSAHLLNIQYTTFALMCVSVFLFLVVFELLSIVSVQDQKITALAQLVGILMEKQKLAEPEHRPEQEGSGHRAELQKAFT